MTTTLDSPTFSLDALARMTRSERDAVLADADGAALIELSQQMRVVAETTPEGPQQRRLARVATELSNIGITRDIMCEFDAEVAAGTRDPRKHVWNGMGAARRGKVAGQDYRVGDVIRVPARALCGAQSKGFDATIVSEGTHGDGVAHCVALMRSGSAVFHVQRHDDGRLVEVAKPRTGRQRGLGIELYHPQRAPQNPHVAASDDEPVVDLDAL